MVSVRVTEVYDLSTQVNKVGMVAIHTPGLSAARSLWPGLFMQYKFVRLAKCDVTVVCASSLPADPLQVGTEAGDIAPQDVFNPILYKAVSNDSFNRVLGRMYSYSDVINIGGLDPLGSVSQGDINSVEDQFKLYYGLLADHDGWRKAMPQQGFSMNGLFPMVYQMVNNYGNMYLPNPYNTEDPGDTAVPVPNSGNAYAPGSALASTFRGPSMRMPRLPTKVAKGRVASTDVSPSSQVVDVEFPKTYVACFIVPPAKLHKFYYRMRVTWTLEFEELRPSTDVGTVADIVSLGTKTYGTDYVEQSKLLPEKSETVDGDGVTIERIMTAGK